MIIPGPPRSFIYCGRLVDALWDLILVLFGAAMLQKHCAFLPFFKGFMYVLQVCGATTNFPQIVYIALHTTQHSSRTFLTDGLVFNLCKL
jgi:hypothetical protein